MGVALVGLDCGGHLLRHLFSQKGHPKGWPFCCVSYVLGTFNGTFMQVYLNLQDKPWAISDFVTGPSVPSVDAC